MNCKYCHKGKYKTQNFTSKNRGAGPGAPPPRKSVPESSCKKTKTKEKISLWIETFNIMTSLNKNCQNEQQCLYVPLNGLSSIYLLVI